MNITLEENIEEENIELEDEIEDENITLEDLEEDEPIEQIEDEEKNEEKNDECNISFESENEEISDEGDNSEKDEEYNDDDNIDKIDISEMYDEAPKKMVKLLFNRSRKILKITKVSKLTKKKKINDIIIEPNYKYLEINELREKTITILKKLTTEKNSNILEKHIFNCTQRNNKNIDLFNEELSTILYETIIFIKKKQYLYKDIINFLKTDKIGLNSVNFSDEQFKDLLEIKNIEEPLELKEGVFQCTKCNSKKTYSYQLQTRSCDEPMTNFIKCGNCGNKWKD